MRPATNSISIFSLLCLLLAMHVQAQKIKLLAFNEKDYPQIRYMLNAPVLLPSLYQDSNWEKMQNFCDNWKIGPANSPELIFCVEILLAIQQHHYEGLQTPCNLFNYLADYARESSMVKSSSPSFRYYLSIEPQVMYDATRDATAVIVFTQKWAKTLLHLRPRMSPPETYLCKVFAGEITNPLSYYSQNKSSLSEFDSLQVYIHRYKNLLYQKNRDTESGTLGILLGEWLPGGNLGAVIGNRVTIGMELGYRDKKNEYGFTYSYKFGSKTILPYTFSRQDSIFNSNYYVGFNVCFDYTRYLVHKKNFDLGLTSGIGIDYFNQYDQSNYAGDPNFKMSPVNLNSIDFGNGIRLKYFFHHRTCIGLVSKYHLLNYCNKGGTDLGGSAFTIDLFWGLN